ncbi:hypothetical protein DIPPA_35179 [Diplonema papillatum]|nr:hypothetical protein DIPPA_35179 [Diplonema papillatum]|eukprot:gene8505-13130_t
MKFIAQMAAGRPAGALARQKRGMWLVEKIKENWKQRTTPTEPWRFEFDAGMRYKLATRFHRPSESVVRKRQQAFDEGKAMFQRSNARRHNYQELADQLNSPSRPLTEDPSQRPKALYRVHDSDVITRPIHVPKYVVHESLKLSQQYPVLYFYLWSTGLRNGSVEAIRTLGGLIKNATVRPAAPDEGGPKVGKGRKKGKSKGRGKPAEPAAKGASWLVGSVTVLCEARNCTPRELAGVVELTKRLRVFGVTEEKPAAEDLAAQEVSVLLRGVEASFLTSVAAKQMAGDCMFPNYIAWDTLGLGPEAGVFSDGVSVDVGALLISRQYTAALRSVLHHVARGTNWGLAVARQDLTDPSRDFPISARFYSQIPPKYGWVKRILDGLLDQYSAAWAVKGWLATPEEVTGKFTQAAAAAVWNECARQRLLANPDAAVPGDWIIDDATNAVLQYLPPPLPEGSNPAEANAPPITAVVLPTVGTGLKLGEWPASCGGYQALANVLTQLGIDVGGVEETGFAHLRPSAPRRLVAVARDVRWTGRSGGLTDWLQGYDGSLRKGRGAAGVFHRDARAKLFVEPWRCVPCDQEHPPSAQVCSGCGEHFNKCTNERRADQSVRTAHTVQITAKLPVEASPAALLAEVFDLRALVHFADQPHFKRKVERSFAKPVAAARRGSPSARRRRRCPAALRDADGFVVSSGATARDRPPQLPAFFRERGSVSEMRFIPPRNPMAAPSIEIVQRPLYNAPSDAPH